MTKAVEEKQRSQRGRCVVLRAAGSSRLAAVGTVVGGSEAPTAGREDGAAALQRALRPGDQNDRELCVCGIS